VLDVRQCFATLVFVHVIPWYVVKGVVAEGRLSSFGGYYPIFSALSLFLAAAEKRQL
jgi:hypothetical protein